MPGTPVVFAQGLVLGTVDALGVIGQDDLKRVVLKAQYPLSGVQIHLYRQIPREGGGGIEQSGNIVFFQVDLYRIFCFYYAPQVMIAHRGLCYIGLAQQVYEQVQ